MSWYLAVIVRGSFVDGALDEQRLGDMLYKLLEAPDAEAAHRRALEIGEASADDYTDENGQTIGFQFLGLADLKEIPAATIESGTEVYSELIPTRPSRRVVDKERLTAFEADEEPTDANADAADSEDPGRFSSNTPIR